MTGTPKRYYFFCALGAFTLFAGSCARRRAIQDAPLAIPPAALLESSTVESIGIYPSKVTLRGADDARQLIVTATVASVQHPQDLTSDVKYAAGDPKVARVTSGGRIIPVANGKTEIKAVYGKKAVKVPVEVVAVDADLPINFANQIVPIFTKLGCNSGGCHGKASGQNGFKLSLLGLRAARWITTPWSRKHAAVGYSRQRRITACCCARRRARSPTAAASAWTSAPTNTSSSAAGSPPARPFGSAERPGGDEDHRLPRAPHFDRNSKQQFAVYAHYSDGSIEDITRRAQYESNDTDIAVVEPAGLVRTLGVSGEAAIMARYQGQVAVFRATVPLGVKTPAYSFPPQTVVDEFTHKKWQQLGLVPSEPCSRRAVHSPRVTRHYRHAADAGRGQGVRSGHGSRTSATSWWTHCSKRPEYSYYFANEMGGHSAREASRSADRGPGAPLRSTTGFAMPSPTTSLMTSLPASILTAIGDETTCPPTVWYKEVAEPRAVRGRYGPSFSRACGSPALSATIIRTRNGARTITGASPPTSAESAARSHRLSAASTSSRRSTW